MSLSFEHPAVDSTELNPLPRLFFETVETCHRLVGAYELASRFYDSEPGWYMDAEQPYRFANFPAGDKRTMLEERGMDVQPLGHQIETGLYVAQLLEAERAAGNGLPVGQSEVGLIVFAALIHDMGEATHQSIHAAVGGTVGDIAYGQKSDEDRRLEARVRAHLYETLYADLPVEILGRVEAIISHADKTILHDIYEAAHELQAYATGQRAQAVAHLNPETAGLHNQVAATMGPRVAYWATRFALAQQPPHLYLPMAS